MKRFVVYTVQIGGYDEIMQPTVVDDRFDYVLFTDKVKSKSIGVWQVRTFNYNNIDKTIISRYPKMHPEELLSGYVASLYIDAKVQIINSLVYERFMQLYEDKTEWGGIYLSDSLYDHLYNVLLLGAESKKRCLVLSCKLRKDGFPKESVVYENAIIFRRHTKIVKQANQLWWEYYNKYCRRDQCTLPIVMQCLPKMRFSYFISKEQKRWYNGYFLLKANRKSFSNQRCPYYTRSGYIQYKYMLQYSKARLWLRKVFYILSGCNISYAIIMITLISYLIFGLYAPVVYSRKCFGKYNLI